MADYDVHKFEPMPGNRKNQPCNRCLQLKSHPNHGSPAMAATYGRLSPSRKVAARDAKGFWAECPHCGFKAWADKDGRITSHRDDRKQNPTWCAGIGKKAVVKWRSSINKASDATVSRHGARDRSAAFDALGTALRSYAKDGRATDGAASYGFATLLAVLLAWYHAQHQSPQDYDLTTYQPARKTFDAVDLKIGDKVTCYAEHPHGVGKVIRMTVNDAIVEWTAPRSKTLPYGHINIEAWPKSDWGLLTKI